MGLDKLEEIHVTSGLLELKANQIDQLKALLMNQWERGRIGRDTLVQRGTLRRVTFLLWSWWPWRALLDDKVGLLDPARLILGLNDANGR